MKRTQRQKRVTPSKGSAKKQQTILSFFSTSATRQTPSSLSKKLPPSLSKKPIVTESPAQSPAVVTPSTTASLDNPLTRPRDSTSGLVPDPSHLRKQRLRSGSPEPLCRQLFSDHDDLPLRPLKRRRVLKINDFSDDESEGTTTPSRPAAHRNNSRTPLGATKLNAASKLARSGHDRPDNVDVRNSFVHEVAQSPQQPRMSSTVDFAALGCNHRNGEDSLPLHDSTLASVSREEARQKRSGLDAQGKTAKQDEMGWCERHSWTVDIRDASKRTPDDPSYDKTTLYVPPGVLSGRGHGSKTGLTPFQRQFWSIKKSNYDVIIFFKKGKFYELYDVDADVGHQQLGLNFTRGGRVDMRCCGVPEQSFDKHCARLIDLGYKVGRVEQTETANAAEKRKSSGSRNQSSVCERSLVRVLTKATVTDEGLLRDHRARYVLSVLEQPSRLEPSRYSGVTSTYYDGGVEAPNTVSRAIAVCYVDVASGEISIGQFSDDFRLARTERLLTFLRPQEIITDLSTASQRLSGIVKWANKSGEAEIIDTSSRGGFSDMTDSLLRKYLGRPEKKEELGRVHTHLEKYPLCRKVYAGMASHLKSLIIDKETLSIGNYRLFPAVSDKIEAVGTECPPMGQAKHLRMDAPTIQNLEVLSSCVDHSERGTLLSFIDRARTPAGRRLLRKWIAEPLVSSDEIEDRLHAVDDIHRLEDATGGTGLSDIIFQMNTKIDLQRALPKLHQQATVESSAVMFDDSNKRKVRHFVAVIRGLEDCLQALGAMRQAMNNHSPRSARLKWLCSEGQGIPQNAARELDFFLGQAFDVRAAGTTGEILPNRGAVPAYDECRALLDGAEEDLSCELKKWQKKLGDESIRFYHRGKEPFQLEVKNETLRGKTPREFEVTSESKAAKRFYTPGIKVLVGKHIEASERYDAASASVARDMIRQFDANFDTWAAIASACAEIDALIGLSFASRDEGSGPMCRPVILPNSHPDAALVAEELRHPTLAAHLRSFVPNDITLGGEKCPGVMILTGPNAGGKSTLARQVAIGAILAQIGCYVPAKSFRLRPFEDIFVRMGASDDLARGRSTFMVEMEEVGHILNNASSRSLIIADEVGRGTSTHDGYAVAYATLRHIAAVNKSLTLFSTHYSHLGQDIAAFCNKDANSLKTSTFEMSAAICENTKRITFLYKLRKGCSGDSRGIYCARVAGIGDSIASNAERASLNFSKLLSSCLASSAFRKIINGLERNPDQAVRDIKEVVPDQHAKRVRGGNRVV